MENFIFQNPTRILFGRGMEEKVGQETSRCGKKSYYIMVVKAQKELAFISG